MDRREALKRTGAVLGFAVSSSAVAAVLSGCVNDAETVSTNTGDPGDAWKPEFFSQEEIELIADMSETILPRTDTPGATDAKVYMYIDIMVKDHYNLRDQKAFKSGLVDTDADCMSKYGKRFSECLPDQKREYLVSLDVATRKELERENSKESSGQPFYSVLKELTWIGFFTSRLIGEEYLNYDPVPGAYLGCIPLDETGGTTWSL